MDPPFAKKRDPPPLVLGSVQTAGPPDPWRVVRQSKVILEPSLLARGGAQASSKRRSLGASATAAQRVCWPKRRVVVAWQRASDAGRSPIGPVGLYKSGPRRQDGKAQTDWRVKVMLARANTAQSAKRGGAPLPSVFQRNARANFCLIKPLRVLAPVSPHRCVTDCADEVQPSRQSPPFRPFPLPRLLRPSGRSAGLRPAVRRPHSTQLARFSIAISSAGSPFRAWSSPYGRSGPIAPRRVTPPG